MYKRFAIVRATALFAALLYSPVAAQQQDTIKAIVDGLAAPQVQDAGIPSLIVGISRHGQRRYFYYGASGEGGGRSDDVVEIGSITKVFTTALYADALRAGAMREGVSIQDYMPGVAFQTCMRKVTPTDLADFRSGLPLLPDDVPRQMAARSIDNYTVADFKRWVSTVTLGNGQDCGLPAPYHYSNASVGLLGEMVSNASNRPWAQLVDQTITGPLGMRSTAIRPSRNGGRIVLGHRINGAPAAPWPIYAWYAAGALRSTPADMLTFGEAALGHATIAGRATPPTLIADLTRAMTPIYQPVGKPFSQAMGWAVASDGSPGGGQFAWKAGGTDGFNSVIIVDRAKDIAIFIVGNRAKSDVPKLGQAIVRALPGSSPP